MTSWHSKTREAQIRELSLCCMIRRRRERWLANRTVWTVTKVDDLNANKAYIHRTESNESLPVVQRT